jgi:inosose dehydratase
VHRRDLLKALGLLGACGDNIGSYGGLRMAIQSWTFRAFPLDQALDMIASTGVTRVELSGGAGHFGFPATDDQIMDVHTRIAARGLDCTTSGLEPVSGDAAMNRAVFEYARKLGLRQIMVDPPPESLDSLDQLVAEFDIRIAIPNHGPGSRYSSIAEVRAAQDGRDRRIGTVIDTGHYTRAGVDPVDALEAFSGRVYGLHIKDVVAAEPGAADTIVGEGVVDFVAIFRALRNVSIPHDASVSLEYEANPADPYADVLICLAGVERASRGQR